MESERVDPEPGWASHFFPVPGISVASGNQIWVLRKIGKEMLLLTEPFLHLLGWILNQNTCMKPAFGVEVLL